MSGNIRCAAFTLAEVLITLAIIGIVAALTIPTLITNYQKKQTVTKLKQTYSVLSQAITMAQVARGDMANYDLGYFYKVSSMDPSFNRKEYLTNFFLNYIKPYVKVAEDYGYKVGTTDLDYPARSHADYYFKLQSGVLVAISFSTGCYNYLPEGNACDEQGSYYESLIFLVDINGFEPPNTQGKDIFWMNVSTSTGKFQFYGANINYSSRASLLKACKNAGYLCGNLIMYDGWQIKDDYPWF